jgi:hypothetical protein
MTSNFVAEIPDFDSTFGDDPRSDARQNEERLERRERLEHQATRAKASSSVFREEAARDEGRRIRYDDHERK